MIVQRLDAVGDDEQVEDGPFRDHENPVMSRRELRERLLDSLASGVALLERPRVVLSVEYLGRPEVREVYGVSPLTWLSSASAP